MGEPRVDSPRDSGVIPPDPAGTRPGVPWRLRSASAAGVVRLA